METYDPAKIGPRIAWGRSHIVYRYDADHVIRIPFAEKWAWGSNLQSHFERDISVCKEYLGEYLLDTRIVQHPKTGEIATIQPYITGHYLSKEDLKDPELKQQFDDLISRHERMVSDGHAPVDLVGQGGVLRRRLSNIMVLTDKKLRLFDAMTADLSGLRHMVFIAPYIKTLVLWRQESTIRYFKS